MNEQQVEVFLLALWNKQGLQWHDDILSDADRREEYSKYSWFTEDFVPAEDLDWSDIVDELEDGDINGFSLKSVERVGGEGQGDHVHWVFTITDSEGNITFWKKNGYYSSYDGSDWSYGDLRQVTPKVKEVKYYE
jgi:hypothetical protein